MGKKNTKKAKQGSQSIPKSSGSSKTTGVVSSFPVTFIVLLGLMSYQTMLASKRESKPGVFSFLVFGTLAAVTSMLSQMTVLTPLRSQRFVVLLVTSLVFLGLSVGWLRIMW